jgi:hypothetical protein
LIKKYNNEKFYIKEKNNQQILIESVNANQEFVLKYTVKSFLSYTLDSTFNLIQNNNYKTIKEDFISLPHFRYFKITKQGNLSN